MKRFKNILFVADRFPVSARALGRALCLAGRNDGSLTVLAVAEPITELANEKAPDEAALNQALKVGLRSAVEDALGKAADGLDGDAGQGIEPNVHVQLGIPFLVAIRQVTRCGHDLVIKGAERPAGPIKRLFGSTDMHLLRKAPCPVWIEPAREQRHHRRILAAIDPVGDADLRIDQTVLELATSLAVTEGADLDVVHAWHLPGESMLTGGRVQITATELEILLESTERRHRTALARTLAPFRKLPIRIEAHFVKGLPSEVIHATARSRGVDLIVMGTVARTGIPGFFIGNTAENVLVDAPCGVLTVKPLGFDSPVR